MTIPSPLWREGMMLGPQHLQQADRACADQLAMAMRAVAPLAHGVVRLQHDPAALAAGVFRLLALEAVLPDSTAVRCDDPDELPAAVALSERWPTGETACPVYLALSMPAISGVDVSDEGVHEGRRTRWRRRTAELPDATGGRPRLVELRLANLRLVLGGENLDDASVLPIARLVHPAADRFEFDATSAPPCVRIDAAPALLGHLRRIEELIAARVTELIAHRRSRARGLVEFAVADIGAVLTLQTLGAHLAVLRQRQAAGWIHPASMHEQLVALCGELAALDGGSDAGDLPSYDHHQPHVGFSALEGRLRALLRSVVHTRYVPIPVTRAGERLLAGSIPEQVTAGAQVFLAIVSDIPAERVIRDVPLRARIASQGRIDALVAASMAGIRATYVPVPPQEIPVQPGGSYFRLEPLGSEWDLAMRTRSLAVFLPPDLAGARVEFLALKDV